MSNQYSKDYTLVNIIENEEIEGQRGDLYSDQPNRTNPVRQNDNGSGSIQLQGQPSIFSIGSESTPHCTTHTQSDSQVRSTTHTRQIGFTLTIPELIETTKLFPSVSLETFQQDQSRNEDNLCLIFSNQETAPSLQSFQGIRLENNGLTVGNGIPILPVSSSSANHFGGLSNYNQNKRPRSENFQNPGRSGAGSSSTPTRRLVWDDNNYIPQHVNNLQSRRNLFPQNQSSSDRSNFAGQNLGSMPIRNTVYDSLYEYTSHPIDPHLQLFLVRKDYGRW